MPYAPATAFLGAEKAKLAARPGERQRVALIADGIGSMHGVTATIEKIRELGVPGFEVEVVGTDAGVDRRLPAAAELEVPFYAGMSLGVPGLPDLVETLAEGRYDAVHVTAPGPAGVAATLLNRIAGTPLIASYHTELGAYAGLRSGDGGIESMARLALGAFYGAPSLVLSPSPAADRSLLALGVDPVRLGRWERGVDVSRFDPGKAVREDYPGEIKVLYAGRLTREKGVDLLAESSCWRIGRIRGCTCCLPAVGLRRRSCGHGSASGRRSSAGSRARTWRAPMPAPTSSFSARPPTPMARSCSRPAPAACLSSRSPRVARPRWSRTATPGCSAGQTPITSPAPSSSSRPRRCCAVTSVPPLSARSRIALGSALWSSSPRDIGMRLVSASLGPGKRRPASPESLRHFAASLGEAATGPTDGHPPVS